MSQTLPLRQGPGQTKGSKPWMYGSKACECVLMTPDLQAILCGLIRGVKVELCRRMPKDRTASTGFRIRLPRGDTLRNEEAGHGITFEMIPGPADSYDLKLAPYGTDKPVFIATIALRAGPCAIEGGGLPFANVCDREDLLGMLENNQPLAFRPESRLSDIMAMDTFQFAVVGPPCKIERQFGLPTNFPNGVAEVPPPMKSFDYGFGSEFDFDEDRYAQQYHDQELRGHQFAPAYQHPTDADFCTAISQVVVQDIWWVVDKAEHLAKQRLSAYADWSVLAGCEGDTYYFVIQVPETFHATYQPAIDRLIKDQVDLFLLAFDIDGPTSEPVARWDAKLIEHPNTLEPFASVQEIDLDREIVVLAHRPKTDGRKHFGTEFQPVMFGDRRTALQTLRLQDLELLEHNQRVQRALLRGCGFDEFRARPDSGGRVNALPRLSFVPGDKRLWSCLLEEVIKEDRERYAAHLAQTPCGLVLVCAPPGTGKTSILVVSSLAMWFTQGMKLFGSGPSHAAVSNFADRFDTIARRVIARYNKGLEEAKQQSNLVVVRGYHLQEEYTGLMSLLGEPSKPKVARPSRWALPLTPSFYILLALGSGEVRPSTKEDARLVGRIQRAILGNPRGDNFAKLVRKEITWSEYYALGEEVTPDYRFMCKLFDIVVSQAAAVFTTPSLVQVGIPKDGDTKYNSPYTRFWGEYSTCVAMDEAANMHVHDLLQVWGNTLRPLCLAGDDKQLLPTVMSANEKHGDGTYVNRFAKNAISPLARLMAHGLPVWRQRFQFRMDKGMFDLAQELFYEEIPLTYAPLCNVDAEDRELGRVFEKWVRTHAGFKLSPPRPGRHAPIFINVAGSTVVTDEITKSKQCLDQCVVALRVLAKFVRAHERQFGDLVRRVAVLAPYKANVELVNELLRTRSEYDVLKGMDRCRTIDGSQGHEADIVFLIFGTNGKTGPGFTSNSNRLCVSLTRMRSVLVLVGEMDAVASGRKDGKVVGEDGIYRKTRKLGDMCQMLRDDGRVATVPASTS
ncbi:hypothetical protein RB598_009792 [Gaeumannomyces tritici]